MAKNHWLWWNRWCIQILLIIRLSKIAIEYRYQTDLATHRPLLSGMHYCKMWHSFPSDNNIIVYIQDRKGIFSWLHQFNIDRTFRVFIVWIDINDCEGNPCFPGGTCKDELDSFTCVCECGYTGDLCDQSMIDSCVPDPCIHGDCKIDESEFFCECYTGYSGLRCELGKSCLRKRLVQPSYY